MKLQVDEIVFREDLYPRIETSPIKVQQYAESLDLLPPIEVNQRRELIDGWHRWTAHKKRELKEIEATITRTASDSHLLELSIRRNASHGLQLSQEDKRDMARRIYNDTPERARNEKKKQLASILSVPDRTLRTWLSHIDKDAKEARNRRIFDLWMACHTQEEIAEEVGVTHVAVGQILKEMADLPKLSKSNQAGAEHATDFNPPIYNIWKQQKKTPGSSHFGNSEIRWLDNLLYLYTRPFDVVVDPFAGGGSTIDFCRKRFRRYWVSDRVPIVERAKGIRKHDVTDGLPSLARWKDVRLVYLDPPYWRQAAGKYSLDETDLANMPLEKFNEVLSGLIQQFASKLSDAYIALIIQPTQYHSDEHAFVDHIGDMLKAVPLSVEMRYSVPYETEQANAQMVEWAKSSKRCLVLTREIVVWSVA